MRVVLVPGAGGAGWYWHRVVPLLEAAGHEAVAVDLPGDDPEAGLPEYAELVLSVCAGAIGSEVLLVGQSLGGFTVPIVAERLLDAGRPPVGIVLLNAMVPLPGETPGAWWDAVGQQDAQIAAAEEGGWSVVFDLDTYFLHDVDASIAAAGESEQRPEAEVVFGSACAIREWPGVSTRVVSGAYDRFFPLALQQRVARDRLGVEPTVVPGGHLAALSCPVEVTAALLAD